MNLHLDVETFCELMLKLVGAYKYAKHRSAEIMLAQWCFDDGPVFLEDFTRGEGEATVKIDKGSKLYAALVNPDVIIVCFNAAFERIVLREIWGIDLPPERFRCTMVHAYSLSFFGSMGDVGEQLGMNPDKRKLKIGASLIQRFCKPNPKNYKVRRYTKHTHPDEWEQFKEYGIQDVVAEREIGMILIAYPLRPYEQKLWCMDQRINDRGVLIDLAGVEGAIKIDAEEKHILREKMQKLTGLANPNSGQQLHGWLVEQNCGLPDLQKATVASALDDGLMPLSDLVREVLKLKQKISKTSVSKYKAFKNATVEKTSRFHGALQFAGAQRTQRWAGRLVQLHNLARPDIKRPEDKAWILASGDRFLIEVFYG